MVGLKTKKINKHNDSPIKDIISYIYYILKIKINVLYVILINDVIIWEKYLEYY